MRKKITSMVLMAFMLISFTPVYAAGPVDGGGNSSGGSGGSSVSGSVWRTEMSGYRITVVDDKKQVVATVVDFLFSAPNTKLNFGSNGKYWYTNSRFTGLSSTKSNYKYETFQSLLDSKQINDAPQYPIYTKNNRPKPLYAGGEEFKEWFLNGKFGMDITNINRKPEYTESATKKVETGTTRPVSSNPAYQTSGTGKVVSTPGGSAAVRKNVDISGGYNGTILITNTAMRTSKITQAYGYVVDQGYSRGANANIDSLVASALKRYNLEVKSIRGTDYLKAVQAAAELITARAGYIGRSNAEKNYLAGMALNRLLSYGTVTGSSLRYKSTSFNDIYFDRIPASKVITPDYYIDEIMNSMSGSKFNFQFNGAGLVNKSGVNTTKPPLEVIQDNNLYIVVEPVFWTRPAETVRVGGRYVATNAKSHYVYGTVANFVEYYRSIGWESGYFYESLTNNLGWSSMYMGNDWKDASGNILMTGAKLSGEMTLGVKKMSKIKDWLDADIAVASHIYRTTPDSVQVTGFSSWDTPDRAPDPKDLTAKSGWNKDYNIVKYYEEYTDGTLTHRYEPLYRSTNPPKIEIVSELFYRVEDWFISASDVKAGAPATYDGAKSSYRGSGRTSTKLDTVSMEPDKNSNPGGYKKEKTLFVKLVNRGNASSTVAGSIVINESELSVRVSTADAKIAGWGLKKYTLPVLTRKFNYVVENVTEIEKKLEGAAGKFAPVVKNNKTSSGGTLDKLEYITTVWRGNDVPTIAAYKVGSSSDILKLVDRRDDEPIGDRGRSGSYNRDLKVELSPIKSKGMTDEEKSAMKSLEYAARVVVKVYIGNPGAKAVGNATGVTAERTDLKLTIGSSQSRFTTGKTVQQETLLNFYPYVRMTYQDNASSTKKDTYVVSQNYSSILPNDYAEVGWNNANASVSMDVGSTQWSIHKKAVDGGQSWNGKDQVLPGGAIYSVTPATNTVVGLATWQTIIVGRERAALASAIGDNEYTVLRATAAHDTFVDEAALTLDDLEVVQWVNADPNAQNAWTNNGKRVKVTGGGIDLRPLGLSGKTSTDAKYYLNPNGGKDDANKADLDIVGSSKSNNVYYKVFSDTAGNIYMAKSIGDLARLEKVNGLKLQESGVTVTTLFAKTVKASDAKALLTGEAKELNERTMLITNFMTALERNSGNDRTASWASADGKWYNEAWDGVYVVRQQTNLSIGFAEPKTRTVALDPALTPKSSGKADLFTKAFVSQYRVEDSSSSDNASSKGPGYLANFKGQDIRLMNMGDIFVSKKFYIPNALVTDSY